MTTQVKPDAQAIFDALVDLVKQTKTASESTQAILAQSGDKRALDALKDVQSRQEQASLILQATGSLAKQIAAKSMIHDYLTRLEPRTQIEADTLFQIAVAPGTGRAFATVEVDDGNRNQAPGIILCQVEGLTRAGEKVWRRASVRFPRSKASLRVLKDGLNQVETYCD